MGIIHSTRVLLGIGLNQLWNLLYGRRLVVSNETMEDMIHNKSVLMLTDDILWEILIRLPTKSLMKFKCVSKRWNNIIRDPFFSKSHIAGFHGLLVSDMDKYFFATYFIDDNNNRIQPHYQLSAKKKYNMKVTEHVTNIVKGLCGLYDIYGEFKLCNLATHELLDLPMISQEEINEWLELPVACRQHGMHNVYHLWFEPVREVYKVFRFMSYEIYTEKYGRRTPDTCLQICTLGEDHLVWRSFHPAPVAVTSASSVQKTCVKGILYLMGWTRSMDRVLVAFDLSAETFYDIPLPALFTYRDKIDLVQVGGTPALLSLASEMGTLWILKEDNETWTKRAMDLMGIPDLACVGTLPTGELLLAQWTANYNPRPIYKYDHMQNKLQNWISIEFCKYWKISYHEDNIVPLDSLIRRQYKPKLEKHE